jgi:lipoprotein NlpI
MKQLVVSLFCICAAASAPQNSGELLKDAANELQAGKTEAALALATQAIDKDNKNVAAYRFRASIYESLDRHKEALADWTRILELDPRTAEGYQQRGIVQFKLGRIDASIRDFDRYIELRPDKKVSHWQRGISYYYAGRYDDGRRQFEGYQGYDSNDVENAVWRFMCMARQDGMARARKDILKIGDDKRVPMRQVYDMFKGGLQPDDVLAAARAGNPPKEQLNGRLFYAHLYIGIYHDLAGDRKKALDHLSAAVEHRIGHYMWDVARIHRDLLARPSKQ